MEIPEQLVEDIKKSINDLYMKVQNEPDFDMTPVFFVGKVVDGVPGIAGVCMIADGHPADVLPSILKLSKPDFGILAFPGWQKDLAGNRTGEMVLVVAETPDSTTTHIAKVTRTADMRPELHEFIKADCGSGALTHFINRSPKPLNMAPGTDTRH